MFLRSLNQEQKHLFLALAAEAANANNIVEECEEQLLIAYADEMGIDVSSASNLELDKILENLKLISTKKELNQIMFELIGMMIVDSYYDDKEKDFLDKVSFKFGVDERKIEVMFKYVNSYMDIIKKINKVILD